MDETLTTHQATLAVSKALGCDLFPRDVDVMIRAWPIADAPPLKGNRRVWSAAHLERLTKAVSARNARSTKATA